MYLTVLEVETQAIFSQIKEIVSDPQKRTMMYHMDYDTTASKTLVPA